jgi:hypothetical protein
MNTQEPKTDENVIAVTSEIVGRYEGAVLSHIGTTGHNDSAWENFFLTRRKFISLYELGRIKKELRQAGYYSHIGLVGLCSDKKSLKVDISVFHKDDEVSE